MESISKAAQMASKKPEIKEKQNVTRAGNDVEDFSKALYKAVYVAKKERSWDMLCNRVDQDFERQTRVRRLHRRRQQNLFHYRLLDYEVINVKIQKTLEVVKKIVAPKAANKQKEIIIDENQENIEDDPISRELLNIIGIKEALDKHDELMAKASVDNSTSAAKKIPKNINKPKKENAKETTIDWVKTMPEISPSSIIFNFKDFKNLNDDFVRKIFHRLLLASLLPAYAEGMKENECKIFKIVENPQNPAVSAIILPILQFVCPTKKVEKVIKTIMYTSNKRRNLESAAQTPDSENTTQLPSSENTTELQITFMEGEEWGGMEEKDEDVKCNEEDERNSLEYCEHFVSFTVN